MDERRDGSWWPAWVDWLDHHSGQAEKPPEMGAGAAGHDVLADAPGTYVLEQ